LGSLTAWTISDIFIEVDCGSLTNDVGGIWKFCKQTRMLAKSCRDLVSESPLKGVELPITVRAFEGLGRELTASLSIGV
jgi:hypothetical protein